GAANPRDHILIYEGPPNSLGATTASVLVSPEPFEADAIASIDEAASRLKFTPILTPSVGGDTVWGELTAPGGPGAVVDRTTADISPPTDDRPFFFQMADVETLLSRAGWADDQVMRPVVTLASLALAVLL